MTSLNAFKEGKIFSEGRHPLSLILTKYSDCVVSYVEDCDLNYVFLECFYLGVPLIHNSPMIKEFGYYYPRLNVSRGAELIKYVLHHHDRSAYIQRHQPLLQKYSVDNPVYQMWIKGRIQGSVHFDCA